MGPGQLIGPGTKNFSAKIQKSLALSEQFKLQMEGSFANMFNHPNFAVPAQNISAASFGRITSTQGAD